MTPQEQAAREALIKRRAQERAMEMLGILKELKLPCPCIPDDDCYNYEPCIHGRGRKLIEEIERP